MKQLHLIFIGIEETAQRPWVFQVVLTWPVYSRTCSAAEVFRCIALMGAPAKATCYRATHDINDM